MSIVQSLPQAQHLDLYASRYQSIPLELRSRYLIKPKYLQAALPNGQAKDSDDD